MIFTENVALKLMYAYLNWPCLSIPDLVNLNIISCFTFRSCCVLNLTNRTLKNISKNMSLLWVCRVLLSPHIFMENYPEFNKSEQN